MPDPFERVIAVTVAELKSPKARSAHLARFAREEIAKERLANDKRLGKPGQPPRITVDGKRGAALGTVRPDGTIIADFNTETEVVRWILRQLMLESPRLTGAYEKSHTLFIDGVEHSGEGEIPDAHDKYVIISDMPYARKLEGDGRRPPASRQATKGVYAAVAAVAGNRFGNQAKVTFGWEAMKGGKSQLESWASNTSLARGDRNLEGDKRDEWLRRQPAITIRLLGDGFHV